MKKYYRETDHIRYSNCHEDVELLLSSLPQTAKKALSIASAGDNTFSLLTTNLENIDTFDTNINQLHLCKLKACGIKYLTYNEFLIFLGIIRGDSLVLYHRIALYLEDDTKTYFDQHLPLISKTKLVNLGRFEYYFRLFKRYILKIIHSKKTIDTFMSFESLTLQSTYYQRKFNNRRFRFIFNIYFSKKLMARYGREQSSFRYANGSLPNLLKMRLSMGFKYTLNKDNPYLSYVIYNQFKSLPFYLQEQNFNVIKERIDRINYIHGDIATISKLNQHYDFFNLSDIFEYMSVDETNKNQNLIIDMANHKAAIAFWNMMVPRTFHSPKLFKKDTTGFFLKDRALYYQAFHVYEVNHDY